jgi:hypothetical protein
LLVIVSRSQAIFNCAKSQASGLAFADTQRGGNFPNGHSFGKENGGLVQQWRL